MSNPRVFAAVDTGTATIAAALVGRVDGRWRLLGSAAAPTRVGEAALLGSLLGRLTRADLSLARDLGLAVTTASARTTERDGGRLDELVAGLPRLACRTAAPPRLLVLAPNGRALEQLLDRVGASGWDAQGRDLETEGPDGIITALLDPELQAVLASPGPAGVDDRARTPALLALIAAGIARRPELDLLLAGGFAAPGGRAAPLLGANPDRPGRLLLEPPGGHRLPTDPLDGLLQDLRVDPEDGRGALARTAGTLAQVFARRIEIVDVGQSSSTRIVADPPGPAGDPSVARATVHGAALIDPTVDDAWVEAVAGWLPIAIDRLRLRDRLRELALDPWAEPAGDGARLRLAAARAALVRLVASTPQLDKGLHPELLVAAGGAWAVAPGPAVALALADTVRRPGAGGLGVDHARLLAPLGMIEDPDERRSVVTDLRDDLLVPLGSVVTVGGLRAGRGTVGQLAVTTRAGTQELELVAGGIELVDLPPGERATLDLRFRDPVDLGARGKRIAVDVGGGLGGLLVDLRDVPLRLPDRADRRRDVLAAWQGALWPGSEA